jgi:hypothetical protein
LKIKILQGKKKDFAATLLWVCVLISGYKDLATMLLLGIAA